MNGLKTAALLCALLLIASPAAASAGDELDRGDYIRLHVVADDDSALRQGEKLAVRDGVLSTPPLACGVRESVERDTVINFAMDLDVPIVEERMTRADLCIADELFLCDAVRGVIPVSSIDGCTIGKPGKAGPKPGPITKAIQERCAKMMAGKLDEYAAWIAQVE